MKKGVIFAIGLASCLGFSVGFAMWTTKKTFDSTYFESVSYSIRYHYSDYAQAGIQKTVSVDGLEFDTNLLLKDCSAAEYVFYGWSRASGNTSYDYPAGSLVSVREIWNSCVEGDIEISNEISNHVAVYYLDLYGVWGSATQDEITINVVSTSNTPLYSISIADRIRFPVWHLLYLDSNSSTFSYYSTPSNSSVQHLSENGNLVTSAKFYANDCLLLDKFSDSPIVLTAHYTS